MKFKKKTLRTTKPLKRIIKESVSRQGIWSRVQDHIHISWGNRYCMEINITGCPPQANEKLAAGN